MLAAGRQDPVLIWAVCCLLLVFKQNVNLLKFSHALGSETRNYCLRHIHPFLNFLDGLRVAFQCQKPQGRFNWHSYIEVKTHAGDIHHALLTAFVVSPCDINV